MLNCDAFIEKYYPNAVEARERDIYRFFNRLHEVIDDEAFEIKLKDKAVVCKLFYLQRLSSITRTHYQKIKDYLVNLFDWLNVDGVIPSHGEVIRAGEYICFFRDLDSAMSFIDQVGESRLKNYDPLSDLVTIKTIFILGWYGLSLAEIAGLKKTALFQSGEDCRINLSDRSVEIDRKYYKYIEALRDLREYKSLPNGRIKVFKGGAEYLFRSTAENERVNEEHITQILKRFNAQIPFFLKQSIAFRYIHTNALFTEIYKDESDKPLIKKVEDITRCSPKQAFSYRTQYLAWVEMIEKNII